MEILSLFIVEYWILCMSVRLNKSGKGNLEIVIFTEFIVIASPNQSFGGS
jgi:hypothetical protein